MPPGGALVWARSRGVCQRLTDQKPSQVWSEDLTEALHKALANMIRNQPSQNPAGQQRPEAVYGRSSLEKQPELSTSPRARAAMVLSPAPFPCAFLAPAGALALQELLKCSTLAGVKPAAGRPLANGSVSAPPRAPSCGNASFLLFGCLPGSRLSACQAQARLLARAGLGAGLASSSKKGAGPSHAHLGPRSAQPGPRAAERGRQAPLRIPAINHNAGNSITVHPNPFWAMHCNRTQCVLGWCLASSQVPGACLLVCQAPASCLLAPGGQAAPCPVQT